jgi:hypothetical protein
VVIATGARAAAARIVVVIIIVVGGVGVCGGCFGLV